MAKDNILFHLISYRLDGEFCVTETVRYCLVEGCWKSAPAFGEMAKLKDV